MSETAETITPAARLNDIVAQVNQTNLNKAKLSPLEQGRKREKLLVEGLDVLVQHYGKTMKPLYGFNSLGEVMLVVSDNFGEKLAERLSTVRWRCGYVWVGPGVNPLPENSWLTLNHFDLEWLLQSAAAEISGPNPGQDVPVVNAYGYMMTIDPAIPLDRKNLAKRGCVFYPDRQSMYESVVRISGFELDQIEGYDDYVANRDGVFIRFDDRGLPYDIDEPIEEHIVSFHS